jgi:hypothetical protein
LLAENAPDLGSCNLPILGSSRQNRSRKRLKVMPWLKAAYRVSVLPQKAL